MRRVLAIVVHCVVTAVVVACAFPLVARLFPALAENQRIGTVTMLVIAALAWAGIGWVATGPRNDS